MSRDSAALQNRWENLAFEAYRHASLRQDLRAKNEFASAIGAERLGVLVSGYRGRSQVLQDRLIGIVWRRWAAPSKSNVQTTFNLASSFERLAADGARLEGKEAYRSLSTKVSEGDRQPALKLLNRKPGPYGLDEIRAFLRWLGTEDRVWAALSLFQARAVVATDPWSIQKLSQHADALARQKPIFPRDRHPFPTNEAGYELLFRRALHGYPSATTFAILVSTLRHMDASLSSEVQAALHEWEATASTPISRLASELLLGIPEVHHRRLKTASVVHLTWPERKEYLRRLVRLRLKTGDPLRKRIETLALQGDTLDRLTAHRASALMVSLGDPPLDTPPVLHFGELELENVRPILRSPRALPIARRWAKYLEEVEILGELTSLGPWTRPNVVEESKVDLLAHVAVFYGAKEFPTPVLDALNGYGCDWSGEIGQRGAVICMPYRDPIVPLHAVVRALSVWPLPRPPVGIVAGTVHATIEDFTFSLTIKAIGRAEQISRVARPGQILLASPMDPAFHSSTGERYASTVNKTGGSALQAEAWRSSQFQNGLSFDSVWCIVSEDLGLVERRPARGMSSS